jgi:hypothetical protein
MSSLELIGFRVVPCNKTSENPLEPGTHYEWEYKTDAVDKDYDQNLLYRLWIQLFKDHPASYLFVKARMYRGTTIKPYTNTYPLLPEELQQVRTEDPLFRHPSKGKIFYQYFDYDYHNAEQRYQPGTLTTEISLWTGSIANEPSQMVDEKKLLWKISKFIPTAKPR